MMKKKTITEAIEHLENLSRNHKESIEDEWSDIKKSLESLEPYFDQLKNQAQKEITEKKQLLEKQIQKEPLITLGIVGLFGFLLGWLFGSRKK
jgi:ElaB/YqjD/DUF883 family membrane-anchored ribosome-binding protein